MSAGMPGHWLEQQLRNLVENSEGFDFEDLVNLVADRDQKMDDFASNLPDSGFQELTLRPIRFNSDEEVLEFVRFLIETYNFPAVLGDAIALAVRLTNSARKLENPEISVAMGEWFSLIESDPQMGDEDLMPRLVLGQCRRILELN